MESQYCHYCRSTKDATWLVKQPEGSRLRDVPTCDYHLSKGAANARDNASAIGGVKGDITVIER